MTHTPLAPDETSSSFCSGVPAKEHGPRLYFLDNLRTFLIFLVVLVHSGIVYESSGMLDSYWIVVDPAKSNLPGLVNLILDIFVMATIFFISGYLAPRSLERQSMREFLSSKVRRLLAPWALAVLSLIPLYNALFLHSRGLPQGPWTSYFHFTNSHISMSWLWFLPVLFLFNLTYLLLFKLGFPPERVSVKLAAVAVFILGAGSSLALSQLELTGWTKTPLLDFQNERLLPYFLLFLLGSVCYRQQALGTDRRKLKLYIAVNSTAWIPLNIYVIVLLNFFLRPGQYLISLGADRLLLWSSFFLSLLALVYCTVTTFRYYFNRQPRLGATLNSLSYPVYIVHMVVMGPVAMALRGTALPTLVKYPILAVATFVTSVLLTYVYMRAKAWV